MKGGSLGVTSKVNRFENFANRASVWLNWVTVAAFALIAIITTIDVVGTKLVNLPLLISFDLISLGGLLAVAPAIAWIQSLHGHIEVEILTRRLAPHTQAILNSIMTFLGVLLFVVMTWQMIDYALTVQKTNRVTGMAEIPFFPFAYFTALCFLMVAIVLLAQFLRIVTQEVRK
jgi:TRAP-type C4-dicarboxylate transport system permease small subunit